MVKLWGSLVDPRKKALINTPAPPGYIAGLGRGATSFTTRSDIGPAVSSSDDPIVNPLVNQSLHHSNRESKDDDDNIDANYDAFNGYNENLCKDDPYDADDQEADAIYNTITSKMDERRKIHRENLHKHQLAELRKHNPEITQQFADLKKELKNVSNDEWLSIPEIADWKNRSKRQPHYDRLTPVPDSVLLKAISDQETISKINNSNKNTSNDSQSIVSQFKKPKIALNISSGYQTPGILSTFDGGQSSINGSQSSLAGMMSEVSKNKLLAIRLNEVSDSVTGQSVIDPKGYLTSLQSALPNYYGNIDDVKKARMLLKSVIETNPKHAPGWIASARVEEVTGKLQLAQNLIMKGCQMCPKSEDIWLEAIRLVDNSISSSTTSNNDANHQKKKVCAMAVAQIPKSVKIWVKSVELEEETKKKRIVIRKALEHIPNSVKLWRVAVDLEEPDDAKILLMKAVECCPLAVDLWLALAKLQNYNDARHTLNRARQKLPTDRSIWITAAKLEESNDNIALIEKIIHRSLQSLQANNVSIKRDDWMGEAAIAEFGSFPETAKQIIDMCFNIGISRKEIINTSARDIEFFKSKNALQCARHIFDLLLAEFPKKASLYLNLANFDKDNGFLDKFENTLYKAVLNCPKAEIFWLMLAKSRYEKKDVQDARKILQQAFVAIPNSEEIWLAASKLELENHEIAKAKDLLMQAQSYASTPRIYMKSAHLQRCLANHNEAIELLDKSLELWPDFDKFYMMKGQILEDLGNVEKARFIYNLGIKRCPNSVPLWLLSARLEFKCQLFDRSRSILERARLNLSQNDILWLESIALEVKCNQKQFASHLTNKALQVCPKSGRLWIMNYKLAEKNQQNQILVNALANCEHDVYAILGVALHFYSLFNFKKAKEWLDKALKADSDCGDVWCAYYALLDNHPDLFVNGFENLVKQFESVNPRHGDIWCKYSKDIKNWQMTKKDLLVLASHDEEFQFK